MTHRWLRGLLLLGVAAALAVPVSAAERLNDKAIEQLGKQVKEGFQIWKKALEKRNLADAVLRNVAGTIDVKEYLKGFEKDIETFNDRFGNNRSAAAEALAVLRKASDVERRVRQEGGSSTPGEWAALAAQCKALAAAYGAVWPIESMEVTLSRLNDKDLIERLQEIARRTKRAKDQADDAAKKTAGMDKAARESLKSDLDSVARLAGDVADKVKNNEPAAVQVSQLLAVAASANARMAQLDLSTNGKNDWYVVERGAAAVAHAFGEPWAAR